MFYNVIYCIFCDGKAKFSISLLQSSLTRDPSEIILICQFVAQNISDYIYVEKQLCCLIFMWNTLIQFFFPGILWWIESSKDPSIYLK